MTRFAPNQFNRIHKNPRCRSLIAYGAGAWLAAAGLLGCMPQNQDEVEQLRAELKAAQAELAALKAQQPATPPAAAAPAPAPAAAAQPPKAEAPTAQAATPQASPNAPPFEEALKKYEAEKRDKEWAVKRENGLLQAAKEHITAYGASVNSVMCKTTYCAIVIDVPEKPKTAYVPMESPWAETPITSSQKQIYNKKTRWTYLVARHDKDYPKLGDQRVDPLALAKQKEKANQPAQPAKTTAAKPAPATPAPAQTPDKPAATPAAAKTPMPKATKQPAAAKPPPPAVPPKGQPVATPQPAPAPTK